jgi:peptidoglycan/xylan/chitin deacetylase (PgdA/CDA1 family)
MSPRRDPVPRARSALHWLRGFLVLGIVAAAVVAAGVKLWENIDIQRLTRTPALAEPIKVPEALPPAQPATASAPFPVVLYYSHASASQFPDSTYYPGLLDRWEGLIATAGARVSRISSAAQIAALGPAAVLVAPDEVAALREYQGRGGGLVLTWATGARDGGCKWRGWEAAAALTGSPDVREIERRDALYLAIPADLPFSVGFDPGTRVELRFESQLAAATTGARVYWSDWALNAAPVAGATAVNAAALGSVTEAGGRVAWFGFRLGQGARAQDEARLEGLVVDGVRWVAGVPMAELLPWPGDARAALLIAEDVESEFTNATALAALARRKAVPATFFVVSHMALDYPKVADSLVAAGEVGSQTSEHTVLAGLPLVDQRARLNRSWAEVRGWTGDSTFGLHPPEERFDLNTLRAWRQAGGAYIVGLNDARTGSPEVFGTEDGEIVLLPRIIKDDYNVFVQESALRARRLTEAYLEGIAKVRALGGIAVLSLRSQVGGDPGRVEVVSEVIDSTRATGDWWIATGREIAAWWSARRTATLRVARATDRAIVIDVAAPAGAALAGAWLRVELPRGAATWVPSIAGREAKFARTPQGVRVALPDLGPGGRATVTLAPGS